MTRRQATTMSDKNPYISHYIGKENELEFGIDNATLIVYRLCDTYKYNTYFWMQYYDINLLSFVPLKHLEKSYDSLKPYGTICMIYY